MDRLLRSDAALLKKLCSDLSTKNDDIEAAREAFGEELDLLKTDIEIAWDELQTEVGAYQDIASEISRLLGGVVSLAEDWRSERSERWRDSEAGKRHLAWCDSLRKIQKALDASADHTDEAPELGDYDTTIPMLVDLLGTIPHKVEDVSDDTE